MATTQKNLDYYRKNAEEDYLTTPISVIRYISEMEAALRQPPAVGQSEQLEAFNEVFQIAWELVREESDYIRLLKIKESL